MFIVILTAIDVARRKAQNNLQKSEQRLKKIVVLPEHISLVVANKKQFREDYKDAASCYPEEMAANNSLRSNKG